MKKDLVDFIRRAKQSTYASESSVAEKTEDGGKRYRIEEGNFVYTDEYFGNLIDNGQERVSIDGKVAWVMSYRGGMVEGQEQMHKEAFSFLKKCISMAPEDFPVRGPSEFEEGDFRYENIWTGDFEGFVGEENIYFKGEQICFRNYIGGLSKNR